VWTDVTSRRRAEAELRSYELAVNSITDVVSVVDRDERYLLVNDAWCRAARVPREQALGRLIGEVLLQRVSEERLQALRDCLASGQTRRARGRDPGARREGCIVETTYFPHLDGQGQVQQVVLVSRDITEQEQGRAALVASEAEQRALLDNFPGYISRLDARDVYTYANQRLARRAPKP
jgi:PAS domain S-box-containing protein